MRKVAFTAAAMLALGAAGSAEARPGGCLRYGLGGAVVGHFAGGHRWKGAALGCAIGIYERRHHQARDLDRSRSAGPNRARTFDRDETGSTGGFGRGGAVIRGGS